MCIVYNQIAIELRFGCIPICMGNKQAYNELLAISNLIVFQKCQQQARLEYNRIMYRLYRFLYPQTDAQSQTQAEAYMTHILYSSGNLIQYLSIFFC